MSLLHYEHLDVSARYRGFGLTDIDTTCSGMLITLVGPAGAGKNQLMNDMIARFAGGQTRVRQFPTATTRSPREGEKDGREHHFVTTEHFRYMIDHDELLEWQLIHGKSNDRYYGMPRATLDAGLKAGDVLMADVEYLGAQRVKELYPDNVISVFVMPPSIGALIQRMKHRGTEKQAEIAKRLLRVPAELAYANECEYVIVNDSFAEAAALLYSIIQAEVAGRHRAWTLANTLMGKFSYHVRVLPVDDASQAVQTLPNPAIVLTAGHQPAAVALQLVQAFIDPNANAVRLIGGEAAASDDLPPVLLEYDERDGHEVVTFVYYYRVDERAE